MGKRAAQAGRTLNAREAAEWFGGAFGLKALRRFRRLGQGPAWYEGPEGQIRYRVEDLETWWQRRKREGRG
jgi:hypothetical protein